MRATESCTFVGFQAPTRHDRRRHAMRTISESHRLEDTFSHEALFYAGAAEFVQRTAAFIREGLEADEPVLVVVNAEKI